MKILRYVGDLAASIFAKDAQNETRAIFGDENPSDDLTDNIDNQKFREGWDLRITRPTVQDFNALGYSLNTLIAYLHQMGVPEWDGAQAYYKNSITNFGGSLFVSLVDDNVGINPVSGKDAVLSWANISGGGGGGTGPVTTVFGRVGNITSQDGDYDLGLIGDVDLTTNPPANTYVLTYNEADKKWEAMPSTAGGVPDGGDTGEILVKNSPIEKDADWSKSPLLAGNILDALLNGTTHGIALGYDVLKSAASKVINGNVFIGKGVGENHTGAVSDSVVIGHAASADKIESDAVAIGSESQTGAGGVSIGSHAGAGAGGVSIGQNAGSQSDANTIAIGADVDAVVNAFDSSDSILVSTNKYKTTEESSGSIVLETPKGSIKYIGGGDFIFSDDVRAPAFYGNGTGLTGIMYSFNGRTGKVSAQDGDYNLKGLADVGVATPADGQILRYSKDRGLWENADQVVNYPVASVFGRTGDVVAAADDYDLNMLGDVDTSGANTNHILAYNQGKSTWESKVFEAGDVYFHNDKANHIKADTFDTAKALNDLDQAIMPPSGIAGLYDATDNKFTRVTKFGLTLGFVEGDDIPTAKESFEGAEIIVAVDGNYGGFDCFIGDTINYNLKSNIWEIVDRTHFKSFNGRAGDVVAEADDYALDLLADVAVKTPVEGHVLKYDGTEFVNDENIAEDVIYKPIGDADDVTDATNVQDAVDDIAIAVRALEQGSVFAGTYDGENNVMLKVTGAGLLKGFAVDADLPLPTKAVGTYFVYIENDGEYDGIDLLVGDKLICDGMTNQWLKLAAAQGGGGGDAGPVSKLVDGGGRTRVEATDDGTETTGLAVIKNDGETKTWLELNQNENTELSILYDSQNPHIVIKDDKHLAFSYLDDEIYKPVSIFRKDQVLFIADVSCMANARFDYEIEVDENAKIHGNLIVDQMIETKKGIDANNTLIKQVADGVDDGDAVNLKQMIDAIGAGGGESGPTSKLVDEKLKTRIEATTDGTTTVGTSQIQNEYGNDTWIEFENYDDIYMEILNKDGSNHIASDGNRNLYVSFKEDGKYNTCVVFGQDIVLFNRDVTFGLEVSFFADIDLSDNRIKNLADPVDDSDAVTKKWAIENLSGGGGGGVDGKPTKLYNDDGATVIHGTTNGWQGKDKNETVRLSCNTIGNTLTGIATFKQDFSNDIIRYIASPDDKTYWELIDFGDKMKWRQKWAKPLIYQIYSDENTNPISLMEFNYNEYHKINMYQQTHFDKGAVLANANNFPWLVGGDKDGRKSLYIKTDPFINTQFTTNYNKAFIFKIDTDIDSSDASMISVLSLRPTEITSHLSHKFNSGMDCNFQRIQNVGDATSETDAVNKKYVDNQRISSLVELDDVATVGVGLHDGDTLEWNLEESQFEIRPKYDFRQKAIFNEGLESSKPIDINTDITGTHYRAHIETNGSKTEVFRLQTNSSQHRYVTPRGAQHIFAIGDIRGENIQDTLIMGPNGTIALTKYQFNGGATMFGSRLESVGEPKYSDDSATKGYVDKAIAAGGGGGEGGGGPVSHLQNADGKIMADVNESGFTAYAPNGKPSFWNDYGTFRTNSLFHQTIESNGAFYSLKDENNLSYYDMVKQSTYIVHKYQRDFQHRHEVYSEDSQQYKELYRIDFSNGFVFKDSPKFEQNLDLNSKRVTNLADPVDDSDAVTKKWALANLSGGGGGGDENPIINDKTDLIDENGETRVRAETSGAACYGRLRIRQNSGLNWLEFKSDFADETNPLHEKYLFKMLHKDSINYFESRRNQNFVFKIYDADDKNPNEVLKLERGKIISGRKHYFEKETDHGGNRIGNVATPAYSADAVNKTYCDNGFSNLKSSFNLELDKKQKIIDKLIKRIEKLEKVINKKGEK